MLDDTPLPSALCLTSEVCRISRRGQREVAAILFVGLYQRSRAGDELQLSEFTLIPSGLPG